MEIYSKGILCTVMVWYGMDEYPSFHQKHLEESKFFFIQNILYTYIMENGLYVMYLKENNVKVENVYNLILFKLSSSLITIIMFCFSSILLVFHHHPHLRFILLDFVAPLFEPSFDETKPASQSNPPNKLKTSKYRIDEKVYFLSFYFFEKMKLR